MPFLRFTRDRRGYENTVLVHTTRRRGREHARVLYWYRSPPHVKVGRPALDEEAIRTLEQSNPDIVFDWSAILESRPAPEPTEEMPPRRRRVREERRVSSRAVAAGRPMPEEPVLEGPVAVGSTDDLASPPAHRAVEPSAAELALGSEGLARLRARHAEVLARIREQIEDPPRAEELRLLADGLDPDAWVTAGDVTAGLEHFEATLDRIRRELGPPRARAGRSRQPDRAAAPGAADAPGRLPEGPHIDPAPRAVADESGDDD